MGILLAVPEPASANAFVPGDLFIADLRAFAGQTGGVHGLTPEWHPLSSVTRMAVAQNEDEACRAYEAMREEWGSGGRVSTGANERWSLS